MSQHNPRRARPWLLLAGIVAAVLFAPPPSARSSDAVEKLREALKIDAGTVRIKGAFVPDPVVVAKREKMIEASLRELDQQAISQLRSAYFLTEWSGFHLKLNLDAGAALSVESEHYVKLGKLLSDAITAAARDKDAGRRLTIALLLAEMEGGPQLLNATPKEKFTRRLTEVVCGLARDRESLAVRQAGLHALGKITPICAQAIAVFEDTLQKDDDLGPRRHAAYGLSELVVNARALERDERLKTIELVISTAVLGLKKNDDEEVRGHCLQALEESARALVDFRHTYLLDDKGKHKTVAELKAVFEAFQSAHPEFIKALGAKELKLRLASLQALDHLGQARLKILRVLQDLAPDKERGELFEEFKTPDPLAERVKGKKGEHDSNVRLVRAVAELLDPNGDVQQRRGAIVFLEMLAESAEPAAAAIARALQDPDRLVQWTAARTIRLLPATSFATQTPVTALARMVSSRDPDLSRAAVDALEAIGPPAQEAGKALGMVIANSAADNLRWDVETRVAAMKALVSIGGEGAQRTFPDLLAAMSDADARVRRKAAESLERIGRPKDHDLAERAIATLAEALRDEADTDARVTISEAILNIGRKKGL